jgi:hypothetical protein
MVFAEALGAGVAGTGHPAAGFGRRGDVGVPQQSIETLVIALLTALGVCLLRFCRRPSPVAIRSHLDCVGQTAETGHKVAHFVNS